MTTYPDDVIKAVTPETALAFFDKYLVQRHGGARNRLEYVYDPETMRQFIEQLLQVVAWREDQLTSQG